MKKISLIVMSCMIACGLLANHGIVKGGEMSPKVEDTVSIDKKIADSQWLSNNSDTLEVDTAGEDSVVNVVAYFCKGDTCEYWIYENEWKCERQGHGEDARRIHPGAPRGKRFHQQGL